MGDGKCSPGFAADGGTAGLRRRQACVGALFGRHGMIGRMRRSRLARVFSLVVLPQDRSLQFAQAPCPSPHTSMRTRHAATFRCFPGSLSSTRHEPWAPGTVSERSRAKSKGGKVADMENLRMDCVIPALLLVTSLGIRD